MRNIAPLVLLTMLAVACGSDDESSDSTAAGPVTTAAPDVTSAPADSSPQTTEAATESSAASVTTTDAGSGTTETSAASADGGTGTCTEDHVGGSLTFGSPSQPAGLDPALVTGSPATGINAVAQIYDTLMQWDPEADVYTPRVAESLEPDDTFENWTLTLRDGIEFGNGDPLTADAVKASIDRFSTVSKGPYVNLTSKITSMEVVDDQTLVFHLAQGWSRFPFTLAVQPGMIVNTAVADAAGEGFAEDPTGAGVGAYEPETFTKGEVTVLRAKDDYWDGPVCIQELKFIPLPADQARFEAFETGEFQATYLRDPLVVEQAQDTAGFGYYVNADNVLLFNAGVGPASPANDVRVRQGMNLALDVTAINDRANEGAGDTSPNVIGEGSAFTSDVAGTSPDVAAATALFDEAKADGWDGTLRLICDAGREEVALAIKAQAEAAGATINIEVVPTFAPLIDAIIVNKDFDAACWGLNISDESAWVGFSNSQYSSSPSNYGAAGSPEMDAAIDDLRVATTKEETTAALSVIQEQWNEIVPAIALTSGSSRTIYADSVVGLEPTSNAMVFFDDAYLDS